MRLDTARSVLRYTDPEGLRGWLRRVAERTGRNTRGALDGAMEPDTKASPAVAYANHGRWVADCPNPTCSAAMLVEEGEPFMCGECFNRDAGGAWRPVAWPKDADALDAELAERPGEANRNWRPGESLADLARESADHGVR